MNEDLKIIKKHYGEKMMHLCRDLFPTLLEEEGNLSKLLLDTFAPNKFLYDDIVESEDINGFKDYIYNLIEYEEPIVEVIKTPKELLSEVGYELYECKTEKDIKIFKKYYAPGEELCTFKGNRLDRCHVFFAVKKNVDEIKRENFSNPQRQDEYGTSVISIQFSKGKTNTLSIKNRYNHIVSNPDATFSNNLENIIPGLTNSFEREYNLNINQNISKKFKLHEYVKANDGKYYKYNYEIDNVYYCPDNIIIDNFEVKQYPKEKYIIIDYYILDLVNKRIILFDTSDEDSFIKTIKTIKNISIINQKKTSRKCIEITTDEDNNIIIEIDKTNKITGYKNNNLTKIGAYFLDENKYLEHIELPKVKKIENGFLFRNLNLKKIELPNVKKIGEDFLGNNLLLETLDALELEEVGYNFLGNNEEMSYINVPKLKKTEGAFLFSNEKISYFEAPELLKVDTSFFHNNQILNELKLPKLKYIGNNFLETNLGLKNLALPEAEYIGDRFLENNEILEQLILPKTKKISNNFLRQNHHLKLLIIPLLEDVGSNFLCENKSLRYLEAPMLKNIGRYFIEFNKKIKIYAPNLSDLERWYLNKHVRLVNDIDELYNTPIKKIEKIISLVKNTKKDKQNKYLIKKK